MSQIEITQPVENYIDENGVLVMIDGGVIPGSDDIGPDEPMIMTNARIKSFSSMKLFI